MWAPPPKLLFGLGGVLQLLMTNGQPSILESLVPAWVSLAEKVGTFLDIFSPSVLRDMRVIIAVLYRVAMRNTRDYS